MHGRRAVNTVTNCVNRTARRIRLNWNKRGLNGRVQEMGGNTPADWAAFYQE